MKRMLIILGALAVFATLLPIRGWAQLASDPGERVRIRHTDGTVFTGVLGSVSVENVHLREGAAGRDLVIPRAEIRQIEESLGKHRSFWRNFGITLGASSVGIGVLSAITWTPCTETGFLACFMYPSDRGEALVWGLAGGAGIGVPVGVLVGLLRKNERWASISVPAANGATISLAPVVGTRFGVAGSITFGGS